MSFATLLEAKARSGASWDNILTDGQFTLTYAALPRLLAEIDGYFGRQLGGRGSCLAVECPNSVPGALTLLYLLQQEISFVLLPPSEQGEQTSAWRPIPGFCQYRLAVKRAPVATTAEWLHAPENFMLLEPNRLHQPPVDPALHAPGYLFLRTSGSMGVSKLVAHSQAKLLANALNCVEHYHFTSADRAVIPVPIAHMYGLGAEFLPAVLAGAALDLQDKANLLRYLEREKHFQPTIAFVTPSICEMLLKGFQRPRTSYKVIVTSGQRIGEALFRAFDEQVNGCLVNQYGSSEMGAIAACAPSAAQDQKATTIGQPMPGVQLMINGQNNHPVAGEEETGELFCLHPYGFAGYVDEKGEWLYQPQPDVWYPTGDLAKRLSGNFIQVVGRADNSINRRGYLVQLADIEQQMEKIPAVDQVVVVRAAGRTNSKANKDEQIVAICVVNPGATATPVQLRQHCFDLLPAYAIPDAVFIVETLPLLPSGKVDRQALIALTAERTLNQGDAEILR
jgi:acyl-coenzyme A synthetase/AMP-(fatty) acid ligase